MSHIATYKGEQTEKLLFPSEAYFFVHIFHEEVWCKEVGGIFLVRFTYEKRKSK
jgi:hypothetical protein